MPTHELLIKIAKLAGDERGNPMVRQIALDKLAAFQQTHPHLFWIEGEGDPLPWTDVATDADAPEPPAPPISANDKARFMNVAKWMRTANGNLSIVIAVKGVDYRVVLFKYKKTPMFGWLRIDVDIDAQVFSQMKYATHDEARIGAWEALCAI